MSDKEDAEQNREVHLSKEDWDKISAGLFLSPDDLHLISAGLELLIESQLQLARLTKNLRRGDNLAECLEVEWKGRTQELLTRIAEHHASCLLKAMTLHQ
jgi:hypothetical protein